jgi:hypothetical protein
MVDEHGDSGEATGGVFDIADGDQVRAARERTRKAVDVIAFGVDAELAEE